MRAALHRGFTLIELMVVVAIIALLIVIGAVSIGAIRGADVDSTGSVLSGAVTYLSSRAVHDNKTYRLVLDLDARRFYTETTNEDDPCSRFIPDEAQAGLNEEVEAKVPEEDEEAPVEGASFAQKKGFLLQGEFQPDTNVSAILTSHHIEPQTGGRAAIYFYPNGQTERALIWVGGKDAESPTGWSSDITIELHSLGTATFHGFAVDERDFDLQRPEEIQ